MNVAMLLSCGSFEGFFVGVQHQTRQSYLETYRNDWVWDYALGLRANGIVPTIYIPSLYESGRYETDADVAVRFLPIAAWYRPAERRWLKRLMRRMRWSLYLDERLNTMAFMAPLRKATREDGIDLVYVQEHWNGRLDHVVHRLDMPVVSGDHGGHARGVVKAFKRSALKKVMLCFAQTPAECRDIEAYGGRSMLASNGCDVSQFCPDLTVERGKTVLTVARLTNGQKRTSDLIHALALLPPDWSLDIVGSGPDKAMLEKLAADRSQSQRIRFHGHVSRGQVRDLLRRCGVYAMPSANEAVALAALEAMACGAAVVLSRIRAFEQIVSDGVEGRLAPVGDVKALAGAILDAWSRRDALGAAARQRVAAQYDSRALYVRLADALRRVVNPAAFAAPVAPPAPIETYGLA